MNAHIAHLQAVVAESERVQHEQAEIVRSASNAVMDELFLYGGALVVVTGRPNEYISPMSPDPVTGQPRTKKVTLPPEAREERSIKGTLSLLDPRVVTISLIEPSGEQGKQVSYCFPVEDIVHIVHTPEDD